MDCCPTGIFCGKLKRNWLRRLTQPRGPLTKSKRSSGRHGSRRKKAAARHVATQGVREMPDLTLERATVGGEHYEVLDEARNVVGPQRL